MYPERYESIENLSLEDKGKILDNIFMYNIKWEIPHNWYIEVIFRFMKNRIDADKKTYDEKCKTNKEVSIAYRESIKKPNGIQTVSNDIQTIPNSNSNSNSNSKEIVSKETGIKIPDNINKDFLKKEITLKINFLIKELQETASQYKIAYNTTKEREFWKHIVNAKQYGAFCDSIWQNRVEFAKNVMTASIDGYWKWICAWPMAIYQNYADVYNKHIQQQTKQIPFIPWI